jgi:hypothetical protein
MSQGARIFLVGSLIVTGITVLGVNYYIDEERKVIEIIVKINFIKKISLEKTSKYFS